MIIWDTETTSLVLPSVLGKDVQPRIIDIAAIQLDPRTGDEVNRFETTLNPGMLISSEITKITGYVDADFKGSPSFAEVCPYLAEFFLGETAMLAHNLPFDKAVLRWELERLDLVTSFPWPPIQLCSVQMYLDELGGERATLRKLYEMKLGRPLDQKHTAMADVEALVEIVRAEKLYLLGNGE